MNKKNNVAKMSAERVLEITRIFDAPPERVWKAWTEPEQFKKWWGPKDFTAPFCKMDFRVGGKYHNCMRSPDGKDYWTAGVYREIIPLKKIVYTDSFSDEKGNVVPASHYGLSGDFELEMMVTVTFENLDGKTRMTLKQEGHPPGKMLKMANAGWNQSFDKLVESLK